MAIVRGSLGSRPATVIGGTRSDTSAVRIHERQNQVRPEERCVRAAESRV